MTSTLGLEFTVIPDNGLNIDLGKAIVDAVVDKLQVDVSVSALLLPSKQPESKKLLLWLETQH
jgi:hypothetical protein